MKLSDFLRWGSKRISPDSAEAAAVKDRRQAQRRLTSGGGWLYWATEAGEANRARIAFVDIAEDSNGLGFVAAKAPAVGSTCWALPDGGKALPCEIRHSEASGKDDLRVGVNLDFECRYTEGAGVSLVHWVSGGAIHVISATIRNSGQGLIEVELPVNIPARQMLYLEAPQYGCLTVCRGARADGSRFIIVAEAASDSFSTAAA